MHKQAPTDNSYIASKLALRRYFLKKYHAAGDARVLDCCQAKGVIWTKLRRELAVAAYWGVDLKPKKGRLKIDSSRILAQPGWTDNVIDVDVYGSPWNHWKGILEHAAWPVTVFLTIGQHRSAVGGSLSSGPGQGPAPRHARQVGRPQRALLPGDGRRARPNDRRGGRGLPARQRPVHRRAAVLS